MKNVDAGAEKRNRRYLQLVDRMLPSTSAVKSLFSAFWIGGLTCMAGQLIGDVYALIMPDKSVGFISNITSMTLIALAILLTGLGFYDVIARRGGAGSFLPITGFANAVASPSIEFKTEGLVTGLGAKMFLIAGPVLVYGITASVLYGVLNALLFGMY